MDSGKVVNLFGGAGNFDFLKAEQRNDRDDARLSENLRATAECEIVSYYVR